MGDADSSRWDDPIDVLADHERSLWCLLGIALFADAVLTWYGLQQGLTEANPVMAAAMAWLGVAGGITVMKVGAVAVAALTHTSMSRETRPLVPLALAVPWTLAALVNAAGLLSA